MLEFLLSWGTRVHVHTSMLPPPSHCLALMTSFHLHDMMALCHWIDVIPRPFISLQFRLIALHAWLQQNDIRSFFFCLFLLIFQIYSIDKYELQAWDLLRAWSAFIPVSSLEAPSTGEEKLLFLHIPAGYPNYIPLIKIMQKKKKMELVFFYVLTSYIFPHQKHLIYIWKNHTTLLVNSSSYHPYLLLLVGWT